MTAEGAIPGAHAAGVLATPKAFASRELLNLSDVTFQRFNESRGESPSFLLSYRNCNAQKRCRNGRGIFTFVLAVEQLFQFFL